MPETAPYPEKIFSRDSKHFFIFAHQDDELAYSGIIQRTKGNAKFFWLTNGDGLAPKFREDPVRYAEKRWNETDQAMKTAGVKIEQIKCLNKSELAIYEQLSRLVKNPEKMDETLEFFWKMGCEIYSAVREFKPDVVWTCAYQGGHPEHDLVHLFACFSAQQAAEEEKKEILVCELPQYEFVILVPLRFKPWKKGVIHEIRLTQEELGIKEVMMQKYPSQFFLFRQFKKVINTIGFFGRIFGKKITFESYASRETFAIVGKDRDFVKSTHACNCFDYMFDSYDGVRISFKKTISVIAGYIAGRKFDAGITAALGSINRTPT
jgi:LmbE family N-acetylglucosaminyl deacetylase